MEEDHRRVHFNSFKMSVEDLTRHFHQMATGEKQPGPNGWWTVDTSSPNQDKKQVKYEIVSPTQQVVEMAKSELKRKRASSTHTRKKHRTVKQSADQKKVPNKKQRPKRKANSKKHKVPSRGKQKLTQGLNKANKKPSKKTIWTVKG